MSQDKKTILITGASSGIGRTAAIKLAKEGHTVFAGIRKKADKEEIESINSNIKGVYLDITNSGSIEKAFWYVMKHADKVDVLINNAGIVIAGPVECLDIKNLKEQFAVNTFGAIEVSKKFIPLLHNGLIINISSMASSGLFPYISAYCASKRALDILFNCFALENKDNIKVVSVKPASIRTPIWNKSVKTAKANFEEIKSSEKSKYEKELLYLEKNALENNKTGIEAGVVVNTLIKIINSKNPKPSYNVGKAAIAADIVSKFPQTLINKIIKSKLNKIR